MDKRYAIFDMDGTLVDSMGFWKDLANEFLRQNGVAVIPPDLRERVKPLTMTESAALFIREFHLPGTAETAAAEMNAMMDTHYRKDIPLKEGVADYLRALKQRQVHMCVASATAQPLMRACLDRLGVLDCFDFLLSCEEVGAGKTRPDVYYASAERMGAAPGEIAVYEDALYAAQTAKNAGFYVVGIYDDSGKPHWEQLKALSDEIIYDWRNIT